MIWAGRSGKLACLCGMLATGMLLSGCGPSFFNAKGTVKSSGGALDAWTSTPIGCHRDVFDGDTSKLVTFSFGNPNANDPDRTLHDRTRPAFPILLSFSKSGDGLEADIQNSKAGEAHLDSTVCRTIQLETKEQMKGFADWNRPLKGTVKLDCTAQQSHIQADFTFKTCR